MNKNRFRQTNLTKSCKDCHQNFIPKLKFHSRCFKCHQKFITQNTKFCSLCKEAYFSNYHKIDQDKCSRCQGKSERKCKYCNSVYIGSFYYSGCDKCVQIKENIFGLKWNSDLFRSGFKVLATYQINDPEHNVYCSGCQKDKIKKIKLPLLIYFKNTDLDDDGIIIKGPMEFYQKDKTTKFCPVCHFEITTTYELQRMKVIKVKRAITLPE